MIKEVKRGEIYYADLSPVVGSEQSGIRPVLIIQNDRDNNSSPTTIVAAITSSKTKAALPTHVTFTAECLPYKSTVLLEQIRTIDKSRLDEHIGKIDENTMDDVDKAIVTALGIKYLEGLLL
jgi:mRNA interferase MazF